MHEVVASEYVLAVKGADGTIYDKELQFHLQQRQCDVSLQMNAAMEICG